MFGGTWQQIKDVFLLASGDSYEAGSTGGEASVVLTQGELPHLLGTIGAHAIATETLGSMWYSASGVFQNSLKWKGYVKPQTAAFTDATSVKSIVFEVGSNEPHNNMPPYLSVYCWERIA